MVQNLSASEPARGPPPIRVLLLGAGTGLRALLESELGDAAAIREIVDWQELVRAAGSADRDVAIVDAGLRWASARDVVGALKSACSRRPVIVLTAVDGGSVTREDADERIDESLSRADARQLPIVIARCLARSMRTVTAELREHERTEAATRASEERALFLVRLADATRPLEKPEAIAEVTTQLLREALGADRCVYADVEPDGSYFRFSAGAHAPNVPSISGRFPISAAGEGALTALLAGKPYVLHDTETSISKAADRELFRQNGIRALIGVPLIKGGRLLAFAGVHMLTPRRWNDDEVKLVDLAAERLWEAMEHARVSRALKASEAEFRGLFELSAVGTAQADPESGRFLNVNRRFCEITGYPEAELLNLSFQDLTHPDDRSVNAATVGVVLRGEAERWEIEKRYVRSNGSPVWVHVSGQLVRDGHGRPHRLIANAIDVTDRKEVEQALIASRRQLQNVTDGAPVLIASCDTEYRYKFVNRAYAERFGREPSQIVGRKFSEIVGEEAFTLLKSHADQALRGKRSEFEAEVHYRDLGAQWIRCAYAPEWDDLGNVVGWVAAILDITDRKRAEEALREADRRKDEFLAVLGHELRNPLAPLRAGLELLKRADRDPKLLQSLRAMMERQLGHLIHLVDDLLDLSRISRGDVELQRGVLDLHEVIDAAVELSRPAIVERRHSLVLRHTELALPIEGDFQRLTQVVGNLLSNAAKYTEPEGTITLSTDVDDDHACVSVSDTGYGIPPERLEKVFDMFSQVPEHRARTGGGGLGIGLALSRQLVALHAGTIAARSGGLGQGSEFVVRLPLAATAAMHDAPPPEQEDTTLTRRVLVVDDNLDAAESMARLLELHGHRVQAVHSGEAALKAVASFDPEVVLLDIGLPEMNGYEVARRIRRMPGGNATRLFALTGWAQQEDKRRARSVGFDEHLAKPVDIGVLQRLIAADLPRHLDPEPD